MSDQAGPLLFPSGRLSLSSRRRVLWAMMGQVFLIMLGISLVGPIMPLYATSFGVSVTMVGGLVTAFGVARIIMNVPVGNVAERIGRRPLLILGPLLTAGAALATGLAGRFEQLLVFRFIQGLGSSAQTTAAMIVLADIATDEDRGRVMSWYQGSLLLGSSFGPTVGGLVAQYYGYRAPFFVYAALSFIAVLWALLVVPETRHLAQERAAGAEKRSSGVATSSGKAALGLLTNTNFLLVSLVSVTVFFTRTGSRNTVLPLYGNDLLGLGPGQLGLAFTLIALINLFATNWCGYLCDKLGRKAVIVPGCIVSGLGLLAFSLSGNYTLFMLSGVLLGLGTGLAGPAPAAYVADLAQPGRHGVTMGIYRTFGDIGVSMGPLLLGWLSDRFSFVTAIRSNALMFILVGLVFALLAKETLKRDRTVEDVARPVST